ncbi:hypothetical protein X975_14102, partial [Stegodyphus mimosarum]
MIILHMLHRCLVSSKTYIQHVDHLSQHSVSQNPETENKSSNKLLETTDSQPFLAFLSHEILLNFEQFLDHHENHK